MVIVDVEVSVEPVGLDVGCGTDVGGSYDDSVFVQ
jgi:hypothetical protein